MHSGPKTAMFLDYHYGGVPESRAILLTWYDKSMQVVTLIIEEACGFVLIKGQTCKSPLL